MPQLSWHFGTLKLKLKNYNNNNKKNTEINANCYIEENGRFGQIRLVASRHKNMFQNGRKGRQPLEVQGNSKKGVKKQFYVLST